MFYASLHISLIHATRNEYQMCFLVERLKSTINRKTHKRTRRSFFTFTLLCKIDREAVVRSKCHFPDMMVSSLAPGESRNQANMLPIHVNCRIMLQQFIFESLVNYLFISWFRITAKCRIYLYIVSWFVPKLERRNSTMRRITRIRTPYFT